MISVRKLMSLQAGSSFFCSSHHRTVPAFSGFIRHRKQTFPVTRQPWGTVYGRSMCDRVLSARTPEQRSDLSRHKRVVVKLGSAVITREDECGLALGRVASIVEQVAELQKQEKEVLIVTSGAVAFGKQRLRQECLMELSLRQNLNHVDMAQAGQNAEPRACAAVGQNGLMYMYDTMFQQYGFKTAQVLVNKKSFENKFSVENLRSTLSHLCAFNIIPIINTNDAMAPPPEPNKDLTGVISIKDNDSLAARLAVEMEAGLLIIMSDVNGLYTAPPGSPNARLLSTYCPNAPISSSIVIGDKSRVGLGGMDSKVKAATWAVNNGTSVVICNGCEENAIVNIVRGRRVGTFFTSDPTQAEPVERQAQLARDGASKLQTLSGEDRAAIINRLADLVLECKTDIINANHIDLDQARNSGLSQSERSRLHLSEGDLERLCSELRETGSRLCGVQGRVVQRRPLAQDMELRQVTVPLGVLLLVAESAAPKALLQLAALCLCSGNGLLVRGGEETQHTTHMLHSLLQRALEPLAPRHTVGMVSPREDLGDLLQMQGHIDLVVPWGSSAWVQRVRASSQLIPVLGHSEGVCHVYVDEHADPDMAVRVVLDSKCQSPSARNALGTLLIHDTHRNGPLLDHICDQLQNENVKLQAGPRLTKLLQFRPDSVGGGSVRAEEGSVRCTVEVVDSADQAIEHINTMGSGHTDSIVTSNDGTAEKFLQQVDSAYVFVNTSTRFSDGSPFGLGTEVGVSTTRVQGRGCVGIEKLLSTKWVMRGAGQVMGGLGEGSLQQNPHTHQAGSVETGPSSSAEADIPQAESLKISEDNDMLVRSATIPDDAQSRGTTDVEDSQSSNSCSDEESDLEKVEKA